MTGVIITILVIAGVVALVVFLKSKKAKDVRRADELAENGCIRDQQFRGDYYLTRDRKKAEYWYEKAAKQGSVYAMDRIRILHDAVMIDRTKGEGRCRIRWNGDGKTTFDGLMLLKNDPECCNILGDVYRNGYITRRDSDDIYLVTGLERDLNEAAAWYLVAAKRGGPDGKDAADGLYLIADTYLNGRDGVELNGLMGRMILVQAAQYGSATARDVLAKMMG